ncbi:hypothetical protein BDW02DRAFT_552352 [Decorospora gaudefroyi]|uniref:Uncharacterized protein n=1 Tax=Decorospora gaudefroyi TaxID=184978 RepID=A0A6A5KG75_9PLEO|nr:hypothetical protein BDW02DRAFT_552352 [Decorospora gaudefroyi]
MVTTRGGTETPGAPTPTPRSSTRKGAGKRELESLETPTQAKRLRKAAPAPTPTLHTDVAKEATKSDAPAEEPSQEPVEEVSDENGLLPIRRRSSPQVVVAETHQREEDEVLVPTEESDFHTPMQRSESVYATPATHWKQREESPTPKATATKDQTPVSTISKRGRGRPRKTPKAESTPQPTPSKFAEEIPSSTYESDAAPIPSQDYIPPSAQPEKTHMRFGSEEPVGPTPTQDSPIHPVSPIEEGAQEMEETPSDSDDEAPEVVTTAAASSKAQAAQADAERAQKAQQAKEQAKRQARAELIATQQAAKREREEKKARKLAKQAAASEQQATTGLNGDEEAAVESRMDIDVFNGLLPASLLETIGDQRPPTPPPERRGKTEEALRKERLNHHIKFLERTEKPTKDVKKGKVSVAVLAHRNRVLPPKPNRDTKNVREHWLKGRQAEKKSGKANGGRFGKMERRPHGSRGFLRDGRD